MTPAAAQDSGSPAAALPGLTPEGAYRGLMEIEDTAFTQEEYDKITSLCLEGYQDMSVSRFREKIQRITDTPEYRELLERFSQDTQINDLSCRNETASFFFYIIEPLCAGRTQWKSSYFSGYTTAYGDADAGDSAVLEYVLHMGILDPDLLTVGEYYRIRLNAVSALQTFLVRKTSEELRNETFMETALLQETELLSEQLGSDSLQLGIDYSFLPLTFQEEDPLTSVQTEEEPEPRQFPNGSREAYDSLLALMTEDYQDLSVEEFNNNLLTWANEHYEEMESIREDTLRKDYQVTLSPEETAFVSQTVNYSHEENACMIKALRNNQPANDPGYSDRFFIDMATPDYNYNAYCSMDFQFTWHMPDPSKITIGERDSCIQAFRDEAGGFFNDTPLDELLQYDEEQIVSLLHDMAKSNSTRSITIHIDADGVFFEKQEEFHEN